ncbi:hypothetical protein [Thalassobacter stenotrophicus]|nr:hypothetical protein [Thalassobacter stenotrophicus]
MAKSPIVVNPNTPTTTAAITRTTPKFHGDGAENGPSGGGKSWI